MIIYDKQGNEIIDINVSDESYRERSIMASSTLTLYFSLKSFVELPLGAYAYYQGQRFSLYDLNNFTKNSNVNYEYTLTLHGIEELLTKFRFFDTGSNALTFSFTAKPIEQVKMLVDVLNKYDSGWSVGNINISDEIVINYSQNSCLEALQLIAETLETEYEITEDKVINVGKVEYNKSLPISLAYGPGKGLLTGIQRSNTENGRAIQRLYVQGGTRNIVWANYGSRYLLLPKSASLEVDGITYLTDADGLSIARDDAEADGQQGSFASDSIYPQREGEISSVDIVDADDNLYDVVDSSIPESLDYSEYQIDGETLTMVFQSGMLTGKEFEVNYEHESRKFEIVPKEIDDIMMPNEDFSPTVGDTYAIFGCELPDAYISDDATQTGASWDLFRAAIDYLKDNNADRYSYSASLSPIWLEENWADFQSNLYPGNYCHLADEELNDVIIRFSSIKDIVNNPYNVTVELNNTTVSTGLSTTVGKLGSIIAVQSSDSNLDPRYWTKNELQAANRYLTYEGEKIYAGQADNALKLGGFLPGQFLRSDESDTMDANLTIKGLAYCDVFQSQSFSQGILGSGFRAMMSSDGNSYIETDYLQVRKEMQVTSMVIDEVKAVGGTLMLTPATLTVNAVEDNADGYKLYFNNDNGNIANQWEEGDQALCQIYTGASAKRYWRLVTEVGVDYITLSKTDYESDGTPAVGDNVVQLGNRNNTARQSAIVLSAYGNFAPSFRQYKGINSYDLTDKEITVISEDGNKLTGSLIVESTGQSIEEYTAGEIDSIAIGSVNLVDNSYLDKVHTNGSSGFGYLPVTLERGKTYTYVVSGKISEEAATAGLRLECGITPNSYQWQYYIRIESTELTTQSVTFTVPDDGDLESVYCRFWKRPISEDDVSEVYVQWCMVIEGNKVITTWQPSLTDQQAAANDYTDSEVAALKENTEAQFEVTDKSIDAAVLESKEYADNKDNIVKSELNAELTIQSDKIATKVDQTEFDELGNKVEDNSTSITQTSNKVEIVASQANEIEGNLCVRLDELRDKDIDGSGELYDRNYVAVMADYIECQEGDVFTIQLYNTTDSLRRLVFYDKDGNFIERIASFDPITAPANSAKMRAVYAYSGDVMFNRGSTPYPYEPSKEDTLAAQEANEAQIEINTNLLIDMAADGKLTAVEKQNVDSEMAVIDGEYQQNVDAGIAAGIATANYATAYQNLDNYITPLLADLTSTSDIDSDTFTGYFTTYYSEQSSLLNAIAASKTTMEEVAASISVTADGVVVNGDIKVINGLLMSEWIKTAQLNVGDNFIVTTDGTMKAVNGEFSGKITATSGYVGGFEIANGRIGVENSEGNNGMRLVDELIGFVNGNYIAAIGSNVGTLSTSPILAKFQNTTSQIYPNYGIYVNVANGGANLALYGNGSVATNGVVQGYELYELELTSTTVKELAFKTTVYIKSEISGGRVILPSRYTVTSSLGMSSSSSFSVFMCIISDGDSTEEFRVYGGNDHSDGYPVIRNENGGWDTDGIATNRSDSMMFNLKYNGSGYYAQLISLKQ